MSRAEIKSTINKNDKVDVVVLAGAKGAKPFNVNGKQMPKPYLSLGGCPLVFRVVRAMLEVKRIDSVFVVGDLSMLTDVLQPLIVETGERIKIIAEGDDLIDNCYRSFFLDVLLKRTNVAMPSPKFDPQVISEYKKQHPDSLDVAALYVMADLPFISSKTVEQFLDDVPPKVALVGGLVDHRELERMKDVLGEPAVLESWKLGAFCLRDQPVRISNMFFVRPLLADPNIYAVLGELYEHRWLLKQDGSILWPNWWAMIRSVSKHAIKVNGWWRYLRGVINFVPAVLAMFMARVTNKVSRWLSWPFRLFLGQKDLEFIASTVYGAPSVVIVSKDPSPAIDIDVEDSYLSLAKDEERDYKRIEQYLKSNFSDSKDE
jgi:GTP:adenosylcobinamide-phosphate guanylyltransferase